jgi:hypothetical protein
MATTPAQGLFKQTIFAKQVALGTPKVGAGGQILRRKSAVFSTTKDSTSNDEMTSHRQDTGITFGMKKVAGKLDGNLSSGTYSQLFAGALMKDFAATSAMTVGTDCTAAATAPQFLDGSSGWLTAGIKVGDVGRFTGFTTTAVGNNEKNFWVTALTANQMTGVFLNGDPVIAKTETGSVVFTVVGKKSLAPLTGHTNDFFTFEEWYADKARSELFPDCKVNQIAVSLPAAGGASVSFDIVGAGTRTMGAAQSFTSPTAETTTEVVQALNGAIYVNATETLHVTSLSLTVDRGITPVGASIGSAVSPDFNQGRVKVSGTFTAMFDDAVLTTLYDAGTAISLAVVAAADATATSDFVAFTMGKIKLTGDAPDDGEKVVLRSYPFTAEINGAGGPALAFDKTILTVQDSAAV